MSLDKALQTAIASIPECVAAGFVDLSTGMLLSAKTVDSHPAEVLEVVAAATADLFQGTNVSLIESMFKKARGVEDDNHHYFQEIIINSDNLLHVFLRSKSNEEHVATFVCRKSANLGMVLTKSRSSMPSIEAAI
ncbi:MAG: hypothetical protein GXP18_13765 [Gammaproteobacteria bacterium]|nr:hypothetical protein [Gammaproteobacteria bacterium]